MHFTKPVAIFISGELAPSMVDTLMVVSPRTQAGINVVLIRVHQCPWIHGVFDEWLDRLLLHVRQEIDYPLTATLNHPKDGWSFLLQGTASPFAFQSASTTFSLLALDHLWLTLMAGNHIGFIALDLIG
jgi:hypothetical protein